MEYLKMVTWSPYVAGIAIGLLYWISFLIFSHGFGCSSSYACLCRNMEKKLRSGKDERQYYQEISVKFDWQFTLVLGIVLGGFISSLLSGDFNIQWVPDMWSGAFGGDIILRLFISVIGGILLGFGARWSGGCTSGHGINGTMQLSIASWITVMGFFAGGIGVSYIIYGLLA